MRLNFVSHLLSIDVWLFEASEDDPVRAVTGGPWSADSTLAPGLDALQQADEQPGDRRRTGFTA